MRAVLARGPGDFTLVERAEPAPDAGGRVLAVEAAGVCAADRMLWRGDGPWQVSWPFVPGHELLGRDLATGERLTCEVMLPCRACPQCTAGRTNLCPHGTHLGSGIDGAFAERVFLPADAPVHVVPDDLPLTAAVLAEPMACALHAVRRAGVARGDRVAVIGLGAVGALALHAARAEGAAAVWAVTRSAAKERLARDLGADAAPASSAATADVVVECSGAAAAVGLALDLVRPGGRVCLYGVYRGRSTVDANLIAEMKELDVRGGHLAPGCFPDAIGLLRSVDHERIVTAVRPLDDVHTALEPASTMRLKEVLVP